VGAARWLNILGILAVIAIITLTLMQQFGYGLAPSYLGTVQRSALIGVAIGPILNLLWGMSPQHYAISLFAAMVGGLSSGLQEVRGASGELTLDPNEMILGQPIYQWALAVFIGAMVSIGIMLLWIKSWAAWDHGITNHRSPSRAITYMTIIWLAMYLVLIIIQTLYSCGAGECQSNPSSTGSQSVMFTFSINGSQGKSASISIPGFISVLIFMGLLALIAALIINHRQAGAEGDDAR
jgi:disulfide bond formation protein DsbB